MTNTQTETTPEDQAIDIAEARDLLGLREREEHTQLAIQAATARRKLLQRLTALQPGSLEEAAADEIKRIADLITAIAGPAGA